MQSHPLRMNTHFAELAHARPFHSNPGYANYRFSSENYRDLVVSARDPMPALQGGQIAFRYRLSSHSELLNINHTNPQSGVYHASAFYLPRDRRRVWLAEGCARKLHHSPAENEGKMSNIRFLISPQMTVLKLVTSLCFLRFRFSARAANLEFINDVIHST